MSQSLSPVTETGTVTRTGAITRTGRDTGRDTGTGTHQAAVEAAVAPDAPERSMHASRPQRGTTGQAVAIDDTTRISVPEGLALFELVGSTGTRATLEVGLAYGFSTCYLLAGLAANGGGEHVAIDPYQDTDWDGIGLTTANGLVSATPTLSFTHRAERSEIALADLQRAGRSFGVIFIDGYHRFDDVLVDFTLAAHLCPLGGAIVLHDMWLDSTNAVAAFLRANRQDFEEVDTGIENLFAVRRVASDERDWTHFEPFDTLRQPGS
jgi:predicted O-methyltransferase YrrM